jgi:hypothetical protein
MSIGLDHLKILGSKVGDSQDRRDVMGVAHDSIDTDDHTEALQDSIDYRRRCIAASRDAIACLIDLRVLMHLGTVSGFFPQGVSVLWVRSTIAC